MHNFKKELRKLMSDFLTKLESLIAAIPTNSGDAAAIASAKADILSQVSGQIDPLTARVSDLETAVTDALTHLAAQNPVAATSALTAVAPAAGATTDASAAGTDTAAATTAA
jgi:hypothetical protein